VVYPYGGHLPSLVNGVRLTYLYVCKFARLQHQGLRDFQPVQVHNLCRTWLVEMSVSYQSVLDRYFADKHHQQVPHRLICVHLTGVYLMSVHLTGVCIIAMHCHWHVPHGRASHGHLPRKRASYGRVSHERISHWYVSHITVR
jgi:hypothetical protein